MAALHPSPELPSRGDARSRILAAAAELVAAGGSEAATTRAVAAAASVQAPTLYRLFGDKDGLLDAVAEQTLADFVAAKSLRAPASDPVDDLHHGWDTYVAFGLANPAVFALMHGRPGRPSRAAAAGLAVLRDRVRRVALTGRLKVTEEHAAALIHAMGTGTVLVLLETPPADRADFSCAARDAIFTAVIDPLSAILEPSPAGVASALRAGLDSVAVLTSGERQLLSELLERIARTG